MSAEALKELFKPFGDVAVKRMFCGYGVYAEGLCFAIESDGEVFLKVDTESRASFSAAGSSPFIYLAKGKPIAGLRVGVKNGGCAGMSYTMELADRVEPLDEVIEDKGVKLLIDPKAILFLLGSEMDFKVDRLSATFAFRNPNETSACGCGESVAITPASPEALNAPA